MSTAGDELVQSMAGLSVDEERQVIKLVDELTEKAAREPSPDRTSEHPLPDLVRSQDSDCEVHSPATEECIDKRESKNGSPQVDRIGGKFERKRKIRTEKWGESVGIVDESGVVRRVIKEKELYNYMILETKLKTDSKVYCSLINERFPRFLDATVNYDQRWRMRYNIFADKMLEDESDDSIVHIGEIHLYFDLIPSKTAPYYRNSAFYEDSLDPEKPLNPEKYAKILEVIDWLRRMPQVLQLRFPVRTYLFQNTNHILDKFDDRQSELMDEARAVYRKAQIRRRRIEEDETIRGSSYPRRYQDYGQSQEYGYGQSRQRERSKEQPRGGGRRRQPRSFRQRRQSFGGQPSGRKRGQSFGQKFSQSFGADEHELNDERNNDHLRNTRSDQSVNGETGQKSGTSSGQSKRYGVNQRVFRGSNRRNSGANTVDDVTFEDTQERQQRHTRDKSANKSRERNAFQPIGRNQRRVEHFQSDHRGGSLRRNSDRSGEWGRRNSFPYQSFVASSEPLDTYSGTSGRPLLPTPAMHTPHGYPQTNQIHRY